MVGKLTDSSLRFLTRHPVMAITVAFGLLHAFIIGIYYRDLLDDIRQEARQHLLISSGAIVHALDSADPLAARKTLLSPTGILFFSLYDRDGGKLASLGGLTSPPEGFNEAVLSTAYGTEGECAACDCEYRAIDDSTHRTRLLLAFIGVNGPGQPALMPREAAVLAAGYNYTERESELYRDLWMFTLESGAMLSVLALGVLLTTRQMVKVEERARLAAEEAVWVKNQFLSNVSHELRTPLNGMMGMVSLLKETKLDKDQTELVTIAGRCADSLLELVENILMHIRFEVGRTRVEKEEFDLAVVLGLLADTFSTSASAKGLSFGLKMDPAAPRHLIGDEEKLSRILTNLLDNAVKFTREGSVNLSVELVHRGGERAELLFIVSDTGTGISPEKKKRLFEPFAQGDGSATREFGGLGMGLCLTRELVNALKGSIEAESRTGKGSEFCVRLPFLVAPAGKTHSLSAGSQDEGGADGDVELCSLANLTSRVGGDRGTALKLFRAFGVDLAEKPAAILKALEAGDEAAAARLASELKQVAGSMGAAAIKSAALEMEGARAAGDVLKLRAKAVKLADLAGRLRAAVEGVVARG